MSDYPPTPTAPANWLHLDLKGLVPSHAKLLAWVDLMAELGFNGIVWECEDRLPWQTWPNTHRPGYDLDEWRAVLRRCEDRGLEVVPLIQTQGHLEWLLKHDRWAAWRENGCYNELCPQHPEVMPAMEAWLDEVIALHPNARYMHIGGDETWNLASCPRCQQVAANHPHGRMGVFIDHVAGMARRVVERGVRPMIWADMFWRENRMDLASLLPEETVLIDWQYRDAGPWSTTDQLRESGREVWGASAVRSSFDTRQAMAPIAPRLENVLGWHAQREQTSIGGVIHTTWGRGRSLMPIYGPWAGWLASFIAAGNPASWAHEPLAQWTERVDQAMANDTPTLANELADTLAATSFDGPWREQCRDWWVLALRHRTAFLGALGLATTFSQFEAVHQSIGVDPDVLNHNRRHRRALIRTLHDWTQQVQSYFIENDLDGASEFIGGRTNGLHRLLNQDWAAGVVAVREPVSAR